MGLTQEATGQTPYREYKTMEPKTLNSPSEAVCLGMRPPETNPTGDPGRVLINKLNRWLTISSKRTGYPAAIYWWSMITSATSY
jgi:hypothetical protein